jgi:hypothetical protein
MHVLQRQLEEQEEDDDLERLKAQYLHREKDDLGEPRPCVPIRRHGVGSMQLKRFFFSCSCSSFAVGQGRRL